MVAGVAGFDDRSAVLDGATRTVAGVTRDSQVLAVLRRYAR
jgi:hypothetical protein